jgi:uncharacterized protein (UPF0332 family)
LNAGEFLQTAHWLASGRLEADWRSATSRAYYAAFHHLRDIAEERVGLPSFGTAEDHADLAGAIRELDAGVARSLLSLRAERNHADYQVGRRFARDRADYAIALAEDILAWT